MTKTKVKICGLFRREDIEIVNSLQKKPDYVGFVFAESRRKVTHEQAAALRKALLPGILSVGVFVNEPIKNIAALTYGNVIDMIQLHGMEDDEYIHKLRERLPNMPVIRAGSGNLADYALFDSPIPGSGTVFDWGTLPPADKPFFLAGGLNPDNVAEAIRRTAPYAVDVSSGVEADGIKNAVLIERFIGKVKGT
jgi:phosphoribosylanthranilate isomerase